MPTTYDQIYTTDINNVIDTLRSEFGNSIHVFHSDKFLKRSNKNIRVSVISQSFKETNKDKFLNNYTIQLKLSAILGNLSKTTYKSFFYDVHRVEQFLLSLQAILDLLNFSIDSISLNDYDEDEVNINGLYNATYIISFSKLKG